MYTSSSRLTGLASGTDTDSYVKQMMFAASTKYYNQQRKLQKLQWKQAAYRTAASTINSFQSKWLDVTSSSSMRMNSTFNSKFKAETTTSAGDTTNAIAVTGIKGNGSHTVKVQEVASAARLDSSATVSGKIANAAGSANFDLSYKGDKISISLENISYGSNGEISDQSITAINTAIQTAINGKEGLNFNLENDGTLTFTSSFAGREMNLSFNDRSAAEKVTVSKYSLTYGDRTTKFKIDEKSDGSYTISYGDDNYANTSTYTSGTNVKDSLQSIVNELYGENKIKVSVAATGEGTEATGEGTQATEGSKITFEKNDDSSDTEKFSYSSTPTTTREESAAFEIIKSTTKASSSSSIASLIGDFHGIKTVSINGASVVIDSDTTISDFISKVTESDAGVKMSYNSVSGTFTLETKETGSDQSILFGTDADTKDVFKSLGFATELDGSLKTATGKDATVEIDGVLTETSSNKLRFDEFTADIKNAKVGEQYTISSSRDVDATYSLISDFVTAYNDMVKSIRSTVNENRSEGTVGYYEPLTDAEKKEMTEDEIKKWETEAKKGILNNDQILKSFLSRARQSLYEQTTTDKNGKSVGIYSYGITTSSDMSKAGELVIDETKLKEALAEDPDAVIDLVKNMSEGLNTTIRSFTATNGLLANKAGIEGTSSEYQNSLLTDINRLKSQMSTELTRLQDKESKLYKMFSEMESLVNQNNTNMEALYSFSG